MLANARASHCRKLCCRGWDLNELELSKTLTPDLLHAVLQVPFEVQPAAEAIAAKFNSSGLSYRGSPAYNDFFDMRRSQYCVLGLEAHEVLVRIAAHCEHLPASSKAAASMKTALEEIHTRRATLQKLEEIRHAVPMLIPEGIAGGQLPKPASTHRPADQQPCAIPVATAVGDLF